MKVLKQTPRCAVVRTSSLLDAGDLMDIYVDAAWKNRWKHYMMAKLKEEKTVTLWLNASRNCFYARRQVMLSSGLKPYLDELERRTGWRPTDDDSFRATSAEGVMYSCIILKARVTGVNLYVDALRRIYMDTNKKLYTRADVDKALVGTVSFVYQWPQSGQPTAMQSSLWNELFQYWATNYAGEEQLDILVKSKEYLKHINQAGYPWSMSRRMLWMPQNAHMEWKDFARLPGRTFTSA